MTVLSSNKIIIFHLAAAKKILRKLKFEHSTAAYESGPVSLTTFGVPQGSVLCTLTLYAFTYLQCYGNDMSHLLHR